MGEVSTLRIFTHTTKVVDIIIIRKELISVINLTLWVQYLLPVCELEEQIVRDLAKFRGFDRVDGYQKAKACGIAVVNYKTKESNDHVLRN